jgi:tetratricopeptide (TPR) repeat protein
MTELKTILGTIKDLRHTYWMIPILAFVSFSVCFKICNDLGGASLTTKLIVAFLVYLISLEFWLVTCWWVPKTHNGVIGIYLCIKTKGHAEREKLHTEIVINAKELIDNMGLSGLISIYELNNLQTSRLLKYLKTLRKNAQSKREERRRIVLKIRHFTNATMTIDGKMSIRNNNDVYYMDTISTVFHPIIDQKLQKQLSSLMSFTWEREQYVKTNDEINGFKSTTSTLMVHLLFIIGFIAYIGDDLTKSTSLLEALYKSKLMDMVGNENISRKLYSHINALLRNSFGLLAARYIHINDAHNAALYLERLLHFGKSYDYFITKAVYDFMITRNIQEALKSVDEASLLAGSDKRWMYSKGFLLYYSYNYNVALNVYYKAMKGTFANEMDVLRQVINFIVNMIKREPDRTDFKFVLGLLCYKKVKNYPLAYKYLDEFIDSSSQVSNALYNRAKVYLSELSIKLGCDG